MAEEYLTVRLAAYKQRCIELMAKLNGTDEFDDEINGMSDITAEFEAFLENYGDDLQAWQNYYRVPSCKLMEELLCKQGEMTFMYYMNRASALHAKLIFSINASGQVEHVNIGQLVEISPLLGLGIFSDNGLAQYLTESMTRIGLIRRNILSYLAKMESYFVKERKKCSDDIKNAIDDAIERSDLLIEAYEAEWRLYVSHSAIDEYQVPDIKKKLGDDLFCRVSHIRVPEKIFISLRLLELSHSSWLAELSPLPPDDQYFKRSVNAIYQKIIASCRHTRLCERLLMPIPYSSQLRKVILGKIAITFSREILLGQQPIPDSSSLKNADGKTSPVTFLGDMYMSTENQIFAAGCIGYKSPNFIDDLENAYGLLVDFLKKYMIATTCWEAVDVSTSVAISRKDVIEQIDKLFDEYAVVKFPRGFEISNLEDETF